MDESEETGNMDDVAERAERGRVFYQDFPGTAVSDRWLRDFEHPSPDDPAAVEGNGPGRIDKEYQR